MSSCFKDKILQIKKLTLKMNPEVICFCVIIIIYDSGVIYLRSLLFWSKNDYSIYFITHIILNCHVQWLVL